MTEIEQLRADLETLKLAIGVFEVIRSNLLCEESIRHGFHVLEGLKTIGMLVEKRIIQHEAQQQKINPWAEIKSEIADFESFACYEHSASGHFTRKTPRMGALISYVRHLESKVAELDHDLRCERIEGGKVRDDRKAISAEQNRQKLAELTTILNAIPPACGEAMQLVKKRIESVKKEMQG